MAEMIQNSLDHCGLLDAGDDVPGRTNAAERMDARERPVTAASPRSVAATACVLRTICRSLTEIRSAPRRDCRFQITTTLYWSTPPLGASCPVRAVGCGLTFNRLLRGSASPPRNGSSRWQVRAEQQDESKGKRNRLEVHRPLSSGQRLSEVCALRSRRHSAIHNNSSSPARWRKARRLCRGWRLDLSPSYAVDYAVVSRACPMLSYPLFDQASERVRAWESENVRSD